MKVTKETFPKEWDPQLLSELVEKAEITLDRGEVISSITMASNPGNYPVYSSSAKNNGLMGYWGEYQIDEELITWSVDGGGYLFYRPKHKFSVTNVCGILRANKDKFNIRYLHYLLEWQHSLMTFDYVDKAHPSVIRKRYLIPTISKSEQDCIATNLSTLDRAIASTEELIAKYQRIKTGLLHDLLTLGIDEHGNLRSEKTHKFKDSKLGKIPVGWQIDNLGRLLEIIDCKHITPMYIESGIPVLRPRNIRSDGIDFNGMVYISKSDYEFLMEKHRPQFGDIVFTRNASFGVSMFIENNIEFAIGQDVVIMTQKDPEIDSYYIFLCMNSDLLTSQILKESAGSTFARINLKLIRKLLVPKPTKHEQLEIKEKITSVNRSMKNEIESLTKLQSLKAGLMQDFLSGKVRIKY